jgi:ABC-2 type transport system ATP-binding protein
MAQFFEVNGLNKTYHNGRGVRDIHFTMDSGQVMALLGPNGSGKTTIMKTILGLLIKDSGSVMMKGLDINQDYEEITKQIGCIVGKVEAYPYLTAYENLRLKANYHLLSDEAIDEVLGVVGLLQHRDEKVKIFSTGMKQRLGIGLALLGNPKLLILDEPFNGMDIDGKRTIRNLSRNKR